MEKWVTMVHMDIKITVLVWTIWAMEGLTEKQVKSVFGQFMTVTLHGRGKKFTQVFIRKGAMITFHSNTSTAQTYI